MADLMTEVYDVLAKHAEEITPKLERRAKLEADIKSGNYTDAYLDKTIRPLLDGTKAEIETEREAARSEANALVTAFCDRAIEADTIKGEDLTEDVRLFSAGITLTARDITDIIKRNAGNHTMEQIALRYAKEHGIDVGLIYESGESLARNAHQLDYTIKTYCDRWFDHPREHKRILARFFGKTPAPDTEE